MKALMHERRGPREQYQSHDGGREFAGQNDEFDDRHRDNGEVRSRGLWRREPVSASCGGELGGGVRGIMYQISGTGCDCRGMLNGASQN